jgi:phage tail sheath protein FI
MGKKGKGKGKGKGGGKGHYLSPGVYIEEVPAASKPIEGVGTSVAAFVGLAPFSAVRLAGSMTVAAVLVRLARRAR